MRKNGFTLAEVLITLAIIGVVATMTLPALITNTGEQQAKTAFKKGINTLTEAAQMNSAIAGFDYASVTSDSKDMEAQSLYGLLATRGSVDFKKTGLLSDAATLAGYSDKDGAAVSTNYCVYFRDGSALLFVPTLKATADNSKLQEDGLPLGLGVVYDTNGSKGPNILSNCKGLVTNGQGATVTNDTDDIKQCDTKANRVIKDQFGVKLRGSYAVPNGAASRWVFEN